MTERRLDRRDRRAFPVRREKGRRLEDPAPSCLKGRLMEWQRRAFERGLMVQAADWVSALAYIEELEARNDALEALRSSHQRGGHAKAAGQTEEQRRAWAVDAAKRRWGR